MEVAEIVSPIFSSHTIPQPSKSFIFTRDLVPELLGTFRTGTSRCLASGTYWNVPSSPSTSWDLDWEF